MMPAPLVSWRRQRRNRRVAAAGVGAGLGVGAYLGRRKIGKAVTWSAKKVGGTLKRRGWMGRVVRGSGRGKALGAKAVFKTGGLVSRALGKVSRFGRVLSRL